MFLRDIKAEMPLIISFHLAKNFGSRLFLRVVVGTISSVFQVIQESITLSFFKRFYIFLDVLISKEKAFSNGRMPVIPAHFI